MLLGSGSIDPDELRTVLKSCLRESAISLPEEKLDDLTLALFESADKDRSGAITFEELKAELENFPEVMENLTIRSAVSLILHQKKDVCFSLKCESLRLLCPLSQVRPTG